MAMCRGLRDCNCLYYLLTCHMNDASIKRRIFKLFYSDRKPISEETHCMHYQCNTHCTVMVLIPVLIPSLADVREYRATMAEENLIGC